MVSSANLHSSDDKSMTPEQFNQVVSAILDGKYSWACVLILRFAGYNPLHYVPYRTYNRLMKENGQFHRMATKGRKKNQALAFNHKKEKDSKPLTNTVPAKASSKIADLNHLEDLSTHATHVRGGFSATHTPVFLSLSQFYSHRHFS